MEERTFWRNNFSPEIKKIEDLEKKCDISKTGEFPGVFKDRRGTPIRVEVSRIDYQDGDRIRLDKEIDIEYLKDRKKGRRIYIF